MNDKPMTRGRKTRWAGAASLLAAGAIGGGVLAGTLSANAATSGPSSVPSATASQGNRPAGHGGAASVRGDEKQVTGTTATKLRAAALKAVPGGTVYRVETDSGDGTYEAHMTKADGTRVTVKFAKNLTVTNVENGMGN